MLKLTYTPTSEITECHLKPGSKWRRVRDESGPLKESYECVMCCWNSDSFALLKGFRPIEEPHNRYLGMMSDTMLNWLRRDFERVVEKSRHIRRLGEVDFDHLFEHDKKVCVKLNLHTADSILCRRIDDSQQFAVDRDQFVRDLGPIEIDDSVRGVE